MPQDLTAAYAQLKTLEDAGYIQIPEPLDAQTIGTIDPAAGTFSFSVPSIPQTFTTMGNTTGTPTHVTTVDVGVILTTAAALHLRFNVLPPQRATTERTAGDITVGDVSNGGVTIEGYPIVGSSLGEIVVNVGSDCSAILSEDKHMDPPVSRFFVKINFIDRPSIFVFFFALRPPVLGIGAFTLPALPVTVIYAPPQNAMKQNTVSYSSSQTLMRKLTTSLSTTTTTKSVEAYSASDLVMKAAEAVASVAAVVGSGGSAAAAPSIVGAIEQAISAIGGPTESQRSVLADVVGQTKDAVAAVGTILQGFAPSMGSSDESSVTTEDDHTITVTFSNTSEYGTKAGLGPGPGDRIVFLRNVRVLWMAIKGEVQLVILGYESVVAVAVEDLQQSLQTGAPSLLGLDTATVKSLLALDVLARPPNPNVLNIHGPVIKGPRFVPADPPGYSGAGASAAGDGITIRHSTVSESVHSEMTAHTTVTDLKPGWIKCLFGVADNVETTTTVTMTTTQSTETSVENELTTELRLYSAGSSDTYDIKIFEDRLLKTYVVLNADSPYLHGVAGNNPRPGFG